MSNNSLTNPSHYTRFTIEPIDAIESWGLNFRLANVVKYVARADHKGQRIRDLQKARWYLDRELAKHEDTDGDEDTVPAKGVEPGDTVVCTHPDPAGVLIYDEAYRVASVFGGPRFTSVTLEGQAPRHWSIDRFSVAT